MKYLIKLSPVFVLAGLVISGMDILAVVPVAIIYGALVCKLMVKDISANEIIDIAVDGAKGGVEVSFIIMIAYVLAEIFTVTGVGASIIGIAIRMGVTGRTVALVCFIATSMLSISTGTSWGSYAACAPIFYWLNHMVGGNVLLTTGALAGAAAFGDHIGLISDTTIMSSGMQGVALTDRVRHQGVWAILNFTVAAILFYVSGVVMGLDTTVVSAAEAIAQIPEETIIQLEEVRPSAVILLQQAEQGMPVYLVIPVIIVIALALSKVNSFICLLTGVISSVIIGFISGNLTYMGEVVDLVIGGIGDAGSWTVPVILLVSALGGIMNRMNAFEVIANFFVRISKKVRHLITCNGLLCLITNAMLSDEMAQIATIGPVVKNITDNHVEASKEDMCTLRLRNAVLVDALGVMGGQLMPWHVVVAYYLSVSRTVYPLFDFQPIAIAQYNYMAILCVVSLLVLTFTGWDRFIPLFKLPSEPDVKLIKHESSTKVVND